MSGKREKALRRSGQVVSIDERRQRKAFEQRVEQAREQRAIASLEGGRRRRTLFALAAIAALVSAGGLLIAFAVSH